MNVSTSSHSHALDWFSRVVIAPPALIFLIVAKRYVLDPVHAPLPTGVELTSPEAMTEVRIVGALVFLLAVAIASRLTSRDRLAEGHALVALLLVAVLGVRLASFAVDGTSIHMGRQMLYVVVEIVVLPLNVIGYMLRTFPVVFRRPSSSTDRSP